MLPEGGGGRYFMKFNMGSSSSSSSSRLYLKIKFKKTQGNPIR